LINNSDNDVIKILNVLKNLLKKDGKIILCEGLKVRNWKHIFSLAGLNLISVDNDNSIFILTI